MTESDPKDLADFAADADAWFAENVVLGRALGSLVTASRRELPAVPSHERVDDGNTNDPLQLLQLPEDEGPVGPRTGVAHIEVVPARRSGELGARIGFHVIAKLRGVALEAAAAPLRVVPLVSPLTIDQESHISSLSFRCGCRSPRCIGRFGSTAQMVSRPMSPGDSAGTTGRPWKSRRVA